MADLTLQEMEMFGRFYGDTDLVNNDRFWDACLIVYIEKVIALPIIDRAEARRKLHDMLDCPPGRCTACCEYKRVPLTVEDERRLQGTEVVIQHEGDKVYLGCVGGCQFLKDGACSIYEKRPQTCHEFPIQQPRQASLNGKEFEQITYRLKCPAGLNVVREIMRESIAGGKMLLLPDLSLVNKVEDSTRRVEG